jgi:hypothetical protein
VSAEMYGLHSPGDEWIHLPWTESTMIRKADLRPCDGCGGVVFLMFRDHLVCKACFFGGLCPRHLRLKILGEINVETRRFTPRQPLAREVA